jgi:hypothetical protein
MKAYILTTGIIFLLIVAAHVARVYAEGLHLIRQPTFAFTSLLSIALSVWAWRLFRSRSTK